MLVHSELTADECHALAAALEQGSRHPVALALLAGASSDGTLATGPGGALPVVEARHLTGFGVEGSVNGRELRLGAADWLADGWCKAPSPVSVGGGARPVDAAGPAPVAADRVPPDPAVPTSLSPAGAVIVHLASRDAWLASFVLEDELRADAAAAVQALREAGCRVHLLSGDQPAAVEAVAAQLGITERVARATPASKLDYVQDLQGEAVSAGGSERCVLMVGDGVNDAPVLAAADVSLAVASASDVAGASADGLLLSGRLVDIALALRQARMTQRIIRQNLAWAMVYNAAAIPLAAGGLVSPWLAGLGMAGSSVLVVANALRLSR